LYSRTIVSHARLTYVKQDNKLINIPNCIRNFVENETLRAQPTLTQTTIESPLAPDYEAYLTIRKQDAVIKN